MKFFVIAALLATSSAVRLSADPTSEHQNEEIGSTPSIAKVAEAAAKKVDPQPVAWDKDTLPNCPGEDRIVMDDGKTHVTKYPYVGASCKAQMSSSSLAQTSDIKSDIAGLEHCPDFDERHTLVNGKTRAVPYPNKGYNCNPEYALPQKH